MATPASPLTSSFDDMDDSFEISFCREKVEAGHKRYLPLFNALKLSLIHIFSESKWIPSADSKSDLMPDCTTEKVWEI